jgi:hypothetical protein
MECRQRFMKCRQRLIQCRQHGKSDKLNARLVAGGNQQDKTLYDDLSAPTVSTSAVLTVLSVAAHEHRKAAVVDIGVAFLNATPSPYERNQRFLSY